MTDREIAEWLGNRAKANKPIFSRPASTYSHVCTIPEGVVIGYEWERAGKVIYLHPVIDERKAS